MAKCQRKKSFLDDINYRFYLKKLLSEQLLSFAKFQYEKPWATGEKDYRLLIIVTTLKYQATPMGG